MDRKRITVSLESDLVEKLDERARHEGRHRDGQARFYIADGLARDERRARVRRANRERT